MSDTTEKPADTKAPAKKAADAAKKKIDEVKKKVGIRKLLAELWTGIKEGKGKETFKNITAIIIAAFSGQLEGLKSEVEEDKKKAKKKKGKKKKKDGNEEAASEETASNEAEPAKPKNPKEKLDKKNFRKGKLFPAIGRTFEFAKAHPKLYKLKKKPVTFLGEPGWDFNSSKETCDNWNWRAAGNTEESMKDGTYKIQKIQTPPQYSRKAEDIRKVPKKTHEKLARICKAIQRDPRMPLFTGFKVTIDGKKYMIVKEIHVTPKGKASKKICQPHTGASYMVYKGVDGIPKPTSTDPVDFDKIESDSTKDKIKVVAAEAHEALKDKDTGEIRRTIDGAIYVFQRQTHYNRNIYGAPGIGAFKANA